MELSCIKYKWVNSLVYSPLKHIKMATPKQQEQIEELRQQIIALKLSNNSRGVRTKKTIQVLQQQVDKILNNE